MHLYIHYFCLTPTIPVFCPLFLLGAHSSKRELKLIPSRLKDQPPSISALNENLTVIQSQWLSLSVNDTHSWGKKKRRQNPDESSSQLHCAKFDCAPKSFHQLRTSMRGVRFPLNGPISSRHLLKFSLIFAWGADY